MRKATTTFTVRDYDEYHAALLRAGLSTDWVVFGDDTLYSQVPAQVRGGLASVGYKFTGFPVKADNIVVPNPKDIITSGIGSIPDLRIAMQATASDMQLGQWVDGSVMDPVLVYSTPVFLLIQGNENILLAKNAGKEEKKKEDEERKRKKDFILLIVSLLLLVRPTFTSVV